MHTCLDFAQLSREICYSTHFFIETLILSLNAAVETVPKQLWRQPEKWITVSEYN